MDYLTAFLLGLTFVAGLVVGIVVVGIVAQRQRARDENWPRFFAHQHRVEERLQRSADAHERAAAALEEIAGSISAPVPPAARG